MGSNIHTEKQKNLTIVKATREHAEKLALRLRDIDRLEIKGMSGRNAYIVLKECASDGCYAVLDMQKQVIAMFGCKTFTEAEHIGSPWLLCSDEVLNYKRELIVLPTPYIENWLKTHAVLVNYVHADNKTAIRWLKYLGFEVGMISNQDKHLVPAGFKKFYKLGNLECANRQQ